MTLKEILIAGKLTVSEGGGGSESEAALLDGSLAGEYENALATALRAGFFESGQSRYPNLTKVSLPEATSIGQNAFYKWVNPFEGVNLPKATSIGQTAFGYCNGNKFTKLVLPSVTSMAQQAFRDCSYLTHLDILGGSSTMGASLCVNCTRLATVIIRRTEGVVPLQGINTFDGTPFASGKAGGTLYVPQALIASYQAASNWDTILGYATNSIAAIEGSIYENAYADGTPID